MHGLSKTTLSPRVSTSTAKEMEGAVHAQASNTWEDKPTHTRVTRGGAQTTLVRVNEGGGKSR